MSTKRAVKSMNDRLYAAAERAGFAHKLRVMQIEIAPTTTGSLFVAWEPEVLECGLDFDHVAVLVRAEKWLEKAIAA